MTTTKKGRAYSPAHRRAIAVESFRTAAECIGEVTPGMSLFAITRGQFSMLDAVRHVLEAAGPSRVSVWTWTVAEYELEVFGRFRRDGRISAGRLVIDHAARKKNAPLIREWQASFGPASVRYVVNHAKIATVASDDGRLRVLLRGSMNLNFNPRFEQLDVTEGGPDFDLVQRIEDELPALPDDAPGAAVYKASRVADAFDQETLALFQGAKVWSK
jgi:hypothetical protein